MIKKQEDELLARVVLFNNLGTAVKHDLRGIYMRTTTSAI
jgi:hypothetical protein